ncbi:hypothetical protein F3J23_14810 [Chryseobacterium sp. Tr-659]|uniref:hypothetical protein n=1 Tax=Chryseobacterium sp. Tr-659 TaxID=2608340 RepID=UPI001423B595|nr:hypothetical protein [Chryseobacterium sp. Tr-659]NIF06717.1 hypothetical protein [Chryseobacterium sp. Tr-659]
MFSCKKQIESPKTISKKKIEVPQPLNTDPLNALKEKALNDYIQTADIIKPNPNNGIPFNQLDYDKIIAYEFAGDEEIYPNAIDKKGKFVPVILKQQFLTQQQADRILSALAKNSSYGESSAACFQPHLGLVFFKGTKKINQISICLSCNSSVTEIHIPARTHKVFNKGTENEYFFIGFTSSGKKAIINLCKQINFQYGNKEG